MDRCCDRNTLAVWCTEGRRFVTTRTGRDLADISTPRQKGEVTEDRGSCPDELGLLGWTVSTRDRKRNGGRH